MNKTTKIDYAISILENEIIYQQNVDLFGIELFTTSKNLLNMYKVMLLEGCNEKEVQKLFIDTMKYEYLDLYKKYCVHNISID